MPVYAKIKERFKTQIYMPVDYRHDRYQVIETRDDCCRLYSENIFNKEWTNAMWVHSYYLTFEWE